jgi:hypothetical protein
VYAVIKSSWPIPRVLRHSRQTTDFYPRIHRWESVWPRWHDDVAYTDLWQYYVIFRSEVGNVVRHHCPHCQQQTVVAWLPALVYLKHAGTRLIWGRCILGKKSVVWRRSAHADRQTVHTRARRRQCKPPPASKYLREDRLMLVACG